MKPAVSVLLLVLLLSGCSFYETNDCQPNHHTVCTATGTYWADSCGETGDLVERCDCGCNEDASACEQECAECSRTADCAGFGANYYCDLNLRRCVCAPWCTGRCCGDDGCGGACVDRCSGGLVCDPVDCECVPDGTCAEGESRCGDGLIQVCEDGAWVRVEQCPDGQVCRDGVCRPATCASREDCAGPDCLVCEEGQCVPPPAVCQGLADCCVGFRCNFGTCITDGCQCEADSDCNDPDFPRCDIETCDCVPVCIDDGDCMFPNQMCRGGDCVPRCSPESCAQGEWCDQAEGECKPGCDSNDDCVPPDTCDYGTHECGLVDCCGGVCSLEDRYCDPLTCQCLDLCEDSNDCPQGFTCDADSGICLCTEGSCPAGAVCEPDTGVCMREGDACDPTDPDACPAGTWCEPYQRVCISQGGGGEGEPCFADWECDVGQNLYCDSNIWCSLCPISDPEFDPDMTCRYGCSLLVPECPAGTACHIRWMFPPAGHPAGLCVPDQ